MALLFKDPNRALAVIHEAGATVDPLTEIVEQMAQTARKAALDIRSPDVVPVLTLIEFPRIITPPRRGFS